MSAELVLSSWDLTTVRRRGRAVVADNGGVGVVVYAMVEGVGEYADLPYEYADLPYRVALTQAHLDLIERDPVGLVCRDARVTGIGWTVRVDPALTVAQ